MRTCDGCMFCCWSYGMPEVGKMGLEHCQHEANGCILHGTPEQPDACRRFKCPYLEGEDIFRPDKAQSILESMHITQSGFIPAIRVENELVQLQSGRVLPAFVHGTQIGKPEQGWTEVMLHV